MTIICLGLSTILTFSILFAFKTALNNEVNMNGITNLFINLGGAYAIVNTFNYDSYFPFIIFILTIFGLISSLLWTIFTFFQTKNYKNINFLISLGYTIMTIIFFIFLTINIFPKEYVNQSADSITYIGFYKYSLGSSTYLSANGIFMIIWSILLAGFCGYIGYTIYKK